MLALPVILPPYFVITFLLLCYYFLQSCYKRYVNSVMLVRCRARSWWLSNVVQCLMIVGVFSLLLKLFFFLPSKFIQETVIVDDDFSYHHLSVCIYYAL